MSLPLQKTKLFLPTARAGLVERPRLLARLDGLLAEGSRVGLVSAPAGAGKTTVVTQWLARQEMRVGWVSLDAGDNAPPRFFAYLIAALREAVPGAGGAALALLDLPGAGMEEVVTLLSNDLSEAAGPFLLALDDFHAITNPRLHQAIEMLVEAQPPQMRLVLLSREDPAVRLARWRARGQLVELREVDLRFTPEEAVDFLRRSMGVRLTVEQVGRLAARTEGWIAGLQMAALALQGQQEHDAAGVERFLRDFSGSHRFILDYLVEEVLARQPEDAQRFLLETSVLERICAGLCGAVTGRSAAEAQRTLESMARANLFLIALDEERVWFRYHHLFRDLLFARLRAEAPETVAALEIRAAGWFEQNGDPRLGVEYALRAGDFERAAGWIDRHIRERWQTVDLDFHLLIQRLPFEVIAARPGLCLQRAWLAVMFGQPEQILPFVAAAEGVLSAAGREPQATDAANRAFAAALRAYVLDLENQPVGALEPVEHAAAAIPEANTGMRNSVEVVVGMICYMEGDFAAALRHYEDALARDLRVSGTNAVPIATTRIALVLETLGRLREAERRLRQAVTYIGERGSRRFYISGALLVALGSLLLEQNRLDDAAAQIEEGLRLVEDWRIPQSQANGLSALARLRVATGDLVGARAAVEGIETVRRTNRLHPVTLEAEERARVDLLIAEGDRRAIEAWAGERAYIAALPPRFRYEAGQIELCRAWLALGRSGDATALLEQLAETAGERGGRLLRISILLAAAREGQPEAFAALETALRLAEPEGFLRSFLEGGEGLRRGLERWLRERGDRGDSGGARLREAARRILALFAGEAPVVQPGTMPEPLSPRELEVLALLAKGSTNQQIADRLVISVRTVKKHVENIHGKLGVQNRTEAADRARALGIL